MNDDVPAAKTELQRALEEREAMISELTELLSCTGVATILIDRCLRLRRFTPEATRLFDLVVSDIDRPISDFTETCFDRELLADCQAVLENSSSATREVDGTDRRTYARRVCAFRPGGDEVRGVVVTWIDISDRQVAEPGKVDYQFLAAFSHELRTPLSAILMWSTMLREHPAGLEDYQEGLKVIERSAEAQKQLLNNLMETCRGGPAKPLVD